MHKRFKMNSKKYFQKIKSLNILRSNESIKLIYKNGSNSSIKVPKFDKRFGFVEELDTHPTCKIKEEILCLNSLKCVCVTFT